MQRNVALPSFLVGAAFLPMTAVAAIASNPLPKELRFQRKDRNGRKSRECGWRN
ncbi:hypothetical protein HMPREF0972_02267 [Actinomyces sp. oral taxon 848 str. F0332]|nr:hypothetical protein HMPREF0972_02267 [Actinomyces sp. oral taxon 848 str. F0332]